jgi:hypothetical protein
MSYDDWKTTEPDTPRYAYGCGIKYRCLDCNWRGRAAEAADHHRIGHHRIALPTGDVAIFSCCKNKLPVSKSA